MNNHTRNSKSNQNNMEQAMQLSPHSTPVPLQYTKVNVLPSLERADPENRPFYICSGPWIPPPEGDVFFNGSSLYEKK